ncbi:hypothetical protein FB45DRAFT_828651 [Roridomyces roridus]|uniref:ubiquitinyl hydrolase 1 n=1 Tax=Roridomyces roridus TaxID=1738132 RepID=A0AAD7C0Z0_9AGAR|nr:hypothetical protein FB45DRAFT_828651 [Roridomyces roridus]
MTTTISASFLPQTFPLLIFVFFFVFFLPLISLRLLSWMALGTSFLPWNWTHQIDRDAEEEEDPSKERAVQERTKKAPTEEDALFPGLVNMSGTHCFMNSTLQALASLSALPSYLTAIRTRAETLDVPTPVVDALLDLLTQLDTPASRGRALRATALVEALCTSNSSSSSSSVGASSFWSKSSTSNARAAALLASHEHQDAQEFFQLISECVREERARVVAECTREFGLVGALEETDVGEEDELGLPLSPFDGLTATRRACVRCGYTAAIRHFAFDTLQLPLEMSGGWGATPLATLLHTYTSLEILQDCPCRRCELRATAHRLADELVLLEAPVAPTHVGGMVVDGSGGLHAEPPSENNGKARARRIKAVKRMHARVVRALEAGRIEEEDLAGWDLGNGGTTDPLKGIQIERVPGGVCTRQSMLGRPPAILALHINRSIHTGMRMVKNGAHVAFPEILDVAPFTTGGVISVEPTMELNGRGRGSRVGDSYSRPQNQVDLEEEECLYRLAAVVCHYGQHSFGHYVCYRRAPVPSLSDVSPSSSAFMPAPPPTRAVDMGWLRISDAHVERCALEEVLAEGGSVFMLYYERVPPPEPPVPNMDPNDSAETLKPGMFGSIAMARPRVVRSVSLGVASGSGRNVGSLSFGRPGGVDQDQEVIVVPNPSVVEDELNLKAPTLPTPPPTPRSAEQSFSFEEEEEEREDTPQLQSTHTTPKRKRKKAKKKKGKTAV